MRRLLRKDVPAAWIVGAILWCGSWHDGSCRDSTIRLLGEERRVYWPVQPYDLEGIADLKRQVANGRTGVRPSLEKEIRRIEATTSILQSLPAAQAAAVDLLPPPHGQFSVDRIDGQLVVDAVSLATSDYD